MAVGDYQPLGFEVVTTGAALANVPPGARHAVIQCETSDFRYRDDGVAASSSVGMRIFSSTSMWYTGDLTKLSLARVTGGSGQLNVSYYT